jgi:hypothetical protein
MATFPNQQLTHVGWDALSEALGGKRLVFVRMAVGDGEIGADSDILDMTDLAHHVRDITITGYRAEGEGRITITGVLRSAEVDEGFYLREVGLFCRLDNAGPEILYSLNNSGAQADYIPDKNEGTVVIQAIEVQVLIGRATNVEVLVIIGEAGLEGENIGEAGSAVFAGREGNRFRFKRLIGEPPGAVTDTADSITIKAADEPTIWDVRLRSFNAIGNPNFEVDQRNVGLGLAYPAGNSTQFQCDRWTISKNAATAAVSAVRWSSATAGILLPGTNFRIASAMLNLLVTTPQATLAAGEFMQIFQWIEGSSMRALMGDVHSISLLVNSSVALTFTVVLSAAGSPNSLVKLVSIPAGVWTLVTLPNLPNFPENGFSQLPGAVGYLLRICLGAGTNFHTPILDSWQGVSSTFFGYAGQSNWLANAGATFNLAFVQHEPGPQCTQLIDKPFDQNLDECLRYYDKSYNYNIRPGTAVAFPVAPFWVGPTSNFAYGWTPFKKPLARAPAGTVTIFNHATGAANSIQDTTGTNRAVTAVLNLGLAGFAGLNFGSVLIPANTFCFAQYVADTGW